jgi:hypothetical protein
MATLRQRVVRPAAVSCCTTVLVVPSCVPAARPATAPPQRRRVCQRVATGPYSPRRLKQFALGALSGSLSGRLAAGSLPGCLAGTRARGGGRSRWRGAPRQPCGERSGRGSGKDRLNFLYSQQLAHVVKAATLQGGHHPIVERREPLSHDPSSPPVVAYLAYRSVPPHPLRPCRFGRCGHLRSRDSWNMLRSALTMQCGTRCLRSPRRHASGQGLCRQRP